MIYKKKVSIGAFAEKGVDIKDNDIITIANEGKQVEGQFGMQDIFLVKLANGEEKNVALNQKSLNNLVDAFGEDSTKWIGKEAKVWIVKCMVSGKFQKVLYLAHPDAQMMDDGSFVMGDPIPVIEPADEIPF